MKILVVGDVHWSETSSIIRSMGEKHTMRLENLVKSVNWAENLSKIENCDRVVYLGDFFDKPEISCSEITVLADNINWNTNVRHDFVVGNHESNTKDLSYSTSKILQLCNPLFKVIDKPEIICEEGISLCYIPYLTEDIRESFVNYVSGDTKIVFSHNDIKGIRYGAFESKEGFDLSEIENNCDLFINGHLHNGSFLNLNTKGNVLNLGNLTGQNFTEDAQNFAHSVCILDTDCKNLMFYENPYAFNFYKFEINDETELTKLSDLKPNVVATIKCPENLKESVENNTSSFLASRIIIERPTNESTSQDGLISINNINHCEEFVKCAQNVLGKSEILDFELSKVIEG